ncbi:structural maintenance of chromosome 2 [Babesia microti strain RI]|uniref:Structural maintenance of chromosomes protein n=1 Tax=Babesia microti (strain RI) TaxID=1133968 RepID=I7J8X4_BABMR|nr:structural maintenance of chromosome 2 [Babesia microti strain RI]CCF73059.1 structural maintenance of chromosome 2 [Babesia microti strain RI]|eukprot:XP_012647668.1 structural maintenance of chromosome 2 [Babesia microti strain RI]
MYIESIIIDGFKSYCNRTVVGPLDPHFNAITGLNGSGKSNVLDSLCFVMGISDLTRMRANKLDDLIYKQGQAGVTKATVTLIFNNKSAFSPLPEPYKNMPELTVTRQIAMGGRNRYFLNGHPVAPKAISDFFQMAKMNVNNPRFLIMQGKITSVVNMTPKELLGLLEEAAGTRLYESKKAAAIKLMSRKDAKLEDINKVLNEEIEPALEKLKKDKDDLVKLTNTEEELERLTRYNVAYTYYKAKENKLALQEKQSALQYELDDLKDQINEFHKRFNKVQEEIDLKKQEIDCVSKPIAEAQIEKDNIEKERDKLATETKMLQEDLKESENAIAELDKDISGLQAQLDNIQKYTQKDEDRLVRIQEELQKKKDRLTELETDVSDMGGGIKLSQLKVLKTKLSEVESSESKINQTLQHYRNELTEAQKQIKKLYNENDDLNAQIASINTGITQLESKLDPNLSADASELDRSILELESRKRTLEGQITNIECQINSYRINVKVPHGFQNTTNLNYDSYLGQALDLFNLKDEFIDSCGIASQTLFGGKLNYLVVSNKQAARKFFDENDFKKSKRKITVLPLNDIVVRRTLTQSQVESCRQLVGVGNDLKAVLGYRDYLDFDPQFEKLVQYVAGNALICSSSKYARTIAYKGGSASCSTVTMDGDRFDVQGNMSGGSTKGMFSVLSLKSRLNILFKNIDAVNVEMNTLRASKQRYDEDKEIRNKIALLKRKLHNCTERIASSEFAIKEKYIVEVGENIDKLNAQLEELKRDKMELKEKIKSLSDSIADWEKNRLAKEASAKEEIRRLKVELKNETAAVSKIQQDQSDIQMEKSTICSRLEKTIEEKDAKVAHRDGLSSKLEELKGRLNDKQTELDVKSADLENKNKEFLSSQKATKELANELKKMETENQKVNMKLLDKQHEMANFREEYDKTITELNNLVKSNSWIPLVEDTFNQANSQFNFSTLRPETVRKRLDELNQQHQNMGRHVNRNAVQIFEKTNNLFTDLIKKKDRVLNDKAKIQEVIENLDKAKMESLHKLFSVVSVYFSNIFHTLLPNAHAKLDLVDGQLANGIEMRIGFNNVWKNSLSELSGGQRSLLALSIVLALLKCRPAPVYILDEIDSALDLSHTQNIGYMIKNHFSYSQFIIVSLKQGMFTNANVLFHTCFVNGASTINRRELENK